jgi:predicted HTH domain antitoxin
MQIQLQINIDDNLLLALKEKDEFIKQMIFHHTLMLYRKCKLSLGKAAELAGYDRVAFIHKLQGEGEPIFDYEDELTAQMAASAEQVFNRLSEGQ